MTKKEYNEKTKELIYAFKNRIDTSITFENFVRARDRQRLFLVGGGFELPDVPKSGSVEDYCSQRYIDCIDEGLTDLKGIKKLLSENGEDITEKIPNKVFNRIKELRPDLDYLIAMKKDECENTNINTVKDEELNFLDY